MAPRLKVISRFGVGVDTIDLEGARRRRKGAKARERMKNTRRFPVKTFAPSKKKSCIPARLSKRFTYASHNLRYSAGAFSGSIIQRNACASGRQPARLGLSAFRRSGGAGPAACGPHSPAG